MSSIKISGLDGLNKRLNALKENAESLNGTNHVSLGELFSVPFMKKYTSFNSINDLFNAGGFKVQTKQDLESIPDIQLDKFIAATTKFTSWKEMLTEASKQYAVKKLGF